MDFHGLKYLVVGAGIFGSVIAERIANDLGDNVAVVEKRNRIGGNCHSKFDDSTGIECHSYGSHIFHTKDAEVWKYINRFCVFNSYRHKVFTQYHGKVYPMPINLATINNFFGITLRPSEVDAFIQTETEKEGVQSANNLEERAVSLIGRPLYEAFIRGYTAKQWETDPRQLPADIIMRLPVRNNYKSDYFDDPWQGMPIDGYTSIFERLLSNPKISVYLNTDYFKIKDQLPRSCRVIYSGPIDRYFDYKFGHLGWRTITFEKETHTIPDYQGTAVMNYADEDVRFTRIHEFKHYHEERTFNEHATVIFKEYPKSLSSDDDPYYPINAHADKVLLAQYRSEAQCLDNVVFGGRLGSYTYLDMDQAIAQALQIYENSIKRQVKTILFSNKT